ncbi:Predicted metal-dependent hydrolase, TIM-barrel fold [Arthrobacter sp. cf158]|uniref:amidohydrolase family protein n=1 Tax=Arthrobacter sp. cf158 TaxID=1761744 RepID=UPI00089C42F1|nr:amidohydrolase family protein [Arthrobacter sp. cf158]SDW60930.1 Predicted metal-dependent hydrolase, TIM-barrel fold [Arthrobacter sp. cf158]
MDIVDSHCHILAADTDKYPKAPLGGHQSVWASERPVTAEQLLQRMDEAGIAQAVLVQATTAYGYDNSYVLDSAARWPDRFVAVGTFDPMATDASRRLRAGIERGLAGVRLFTTGSTVSEQGMWFADEATDEFWAAASHENIPVCLQLRLGDDTAPVLKDLLSRHPDATILLDHCGYPDVRTSPTKAADDLTALAGHPGLHLKLTHRTLEGLDDIGERARDFLDPLIEAFGADRISWGSNCPAAEQTLEELRSLAERVLSVIPHKTRESIFNETTRRLYPALGTT